MEWSLVLVYWSLYGTNFIAYLNMVIIKVRMVKSSFLPRYPFEALWELVMIIPSLDNEEMMEEINTLKKFIHGFQYDDHLMP